MSDLTSTLSLNSHYLILAYFLIQTKGFGVSLSLFQFGVCKLVHRIWMFLFQVLGITSPEAGWKSLACLGVLGYLLVDAFGC